MQPKTTVSHQDLLDRFLEYCRTFRAPPGLFAPDVVCTYHVPGGHYEQRTPRGMEAELEPYGAGSEVEVKAAEVTPAGFIVEFTQRAPAGLYEELAWARVENGRIKAITLYCTGAVHEG